ncbi:MAG: hypothetical protein IT428_06685 [Planctomycetaceae bacterium]|nr:hypothetical protein [Planctomycetaceae bacterium]
MATCNGTPPGVGGGCGNGGSLGEDGLCWALTNVCWRDINTCGTVSTNGRVVISECTDHTQWPKCSGPGIITYTDCNDEVVTETLRFSSHCVPDGWRWYDSWDGGSIAFTVPCDGSFGPDDIDLVIDGCTTTVDTATITCDGPLGYASMEFTFSGTCGECAIEGCGAFGAESCEVPSPCGGCDSPPTTAFATVTSSCGAVNGATGSGDRDGDQYEATLSACGLTATLICQESGFNISMSPAECFLTPLTAATGACDPFSWSASFLYINGGSCTCCDTGSITVTFTE